MTQASVDKLANHARLLRESGAPHQQELADHIEAVIGVRPVSTGGAAAPDADKDATIAQLRKNVADLVDERNALKDELAALKNQRTTFGIQQDVPKESHANLKKPVASKKHA